MICGKIRIPGRILDSLKEGNLVVFAGAGVSVGEPANLPSFKGLCQKIAHGKGETPREGESEECFLGRLKDSGVDIHSIAAEIIGQADAPTSLHKDLLRLFGKGEEVRIVTTNQDLLFENAVETLYEDKPKVYSAPALPLGTAFQGIVHIHGSIEVPMEMVFTDTDFGRAYLSEGWATRFLIDLFSTAKILFVGYSHDDTIMRYLARALPTEKGNRFALIRESEEPDKWRQLGIETVFFPHDVEIGYTELYNGIRILADVANRSILDWKNEITAISQGYPPIGDRDSGIMEYALERESTFRFITESVVRPEWINWFDENGFLEPLLCTDHVLDVRHGILATWLAKTFVGTNSLVLFQLFARYNLGIHPVLWGRVLREVCSDEHDMDHNVFSRWVSLLLNDVPDSPQEVLLLMLGERCVKHNAMNLLLEVFDKMSEQLLILKEGYCWSDDEQPIQTDVEVKFRSVSGIHYLHELLSKGLYPNLDSVHGKLLDISLSRLERRNAVRFQWQKEFDPDSYRRSAIEPDDQDRYPDDVSLLIDVSRICLEYLGNNSPDLLDLRIAALSGSTCNLIRRLVIHALCERQDWTSDDKLNWLLSKCNIHELPLHHEIFRLVGQTFADSDLTTQNKLLNAIQEFEWKYDDDEDENRRHTAYTHFNWMSWLHRTTDACEELNEHLDTILREYPTFKPQKRQDLTHWMSDIKREKMSSPWSFEEAHSSDPIRFIDEILSYLSNVDVVHKGPGLSTIKEVAKSEFNWGLNLALTLHKRSEYPIEVFAVLIDAWAELELTEEQVTLVLDVISAACHLTDPFAFRAADFLLKTLRKADKGVIPEMRERMDSIASTLWSNQDMAAPIESDEDWYGRAINHTSGVLAEYWLYSLSACRSTDDNKETGISPKYEDALTIILNDESVCGVMGKSILAGQIPFLLDVDEQWVCEHLVPLLLDPSNSIVYQAVWHGFLTQGRLTPSTQAVMIDVFSSSVVAWMDSEDHWFTRFIGFYTALAFYFIENPFSNDWISTLFNAGGVKVRIEFAKAALQFISEMTEAELHELVNRWLLDYMKARLKGIPAPLDNVEERLAMFNWLPSLLIVSPEIAELYLGFPTDNLTQCNWIFEYLEKELQNTHPEFTARLILHLGSSNVAASLVYDLSRLLGSLNREELNEGIRVALLELEAEICM
jgi:hypothetical protein